MIDCTANYSVVKNSKETGYVFTKNKRTNEKPLRFLEKELFTLTLRKV